MDEAEILTLKPGTPRRPAREELSLWEGGFALLPRGHAWVGRDTRCRARCRVPPAFLCNPPGFSPGFRKLNCVN